jgi:hypothetical protein
MHVYAWMLTIGLRGALREIPFEDILLLLDSSAHAWQLPVMGQKTPPATISDIMESDSVVVKGLEEA